MSTITTTGPAARRPSPHAAPAHRGAPRRRPAPPAARGRAVAVVVAAPGGGHGRPFSAARRRRVAATGGEQTSAEEVLPRGRHPPGRLAWSGSTPGRPSGASRRCRGWPSATVTRTWPGGVDGERSDERKATAAVRITDTRWAEIDEERPGAVGRRRRPGRDARGAGASRAGIAEGERLPSAADRRAARCSTPPRPPARRRHRGRHRARRDPGLRRRSCVSASPASSTPRSPRCKRCSPGSTSAAWP